MEELGRILMVEDDPKDVELALTALEEYNLANEVVVARDGQQALDYLYCRGEFKARLRENPAVLLLDLACRAPSGAPSLPSRSSKANSATPKLLRERNSPARRSAGWVGLVMILLFGTALAFGLAIVVAVVACAVLKVAKAGRTARITCTIVMLAPPIGSPERVLFARLVEVGWGILVAVALMWIVERLSATDIDCQPNCYYRIRM